MPSIPSCLSMPVALANSSACDSRMISHRCRAPFHHIVLRRRRNNRPRFQAGAICRCPLMRKYGIVRLPRPLGMCDRFLLVEYKQVPKIELWKKRELWALANCASASFPAFSRFGERFLRGLLTVRRAFPSRPSRTQRYTTPHTLHTFFSMQHFSLRVWLLFFWCAAPVETAHHVRGSAGSHSKWQFHVGRDWCLAETRVS